MHKIRRTIWIVCSIVVFTMTAMAQSTSQFEVDGRWMNGVSEPWWFEAVHPRNEVLVVQQKWADIESQLRTSSDHRWEGDFFEGTDTHGDYLRWSSKAGFVWLKVDKCRATVMSFSYGKVSAGPTSVELVPEKTIGGTKHHRQIDFAAVKFLPVAWSKELMLVPQSDIASFGDYVAGLGQYNQLLMFVEGIMFFSRTVDDEYPDSKDPIVPPGYERFIKKPINATVVSVGKPYTKRSDNEWWDDLITPVSLKLSRVGAKPKLMLRIADSEEVIELTAVRGQSAFGKIVRPTRKKPCVKLDEEDDCLDREFDAIKVETKASTLIETP